MRLPAGDRHKSSRVMIHVETNRIPDKKTYVLGGGDSLIRSKAGTQGTNTICMPASTFFASAMGLSTSSELRYARVLYMGRIRIRQSPCTPRIPTKRPNHQ